MLGRRAAVGTTVALLAATGAGGAFAATHGSAASKPATRPGATMPHGNCPNMGSSPSATSNASDT